MPRMSPQVAFAAFASTLSLAALALSAPVLSPSRGQAHTLVPAMAQMPAAQLPALPAILPR